MSVVITGHVDHGKSTVIGRLVADTGNLPKGKLEQVRRTCESNSKPFEYAFLLDALKDEQSQGITIDSARVFFKTSRRRYIVIDSPGHIEFLRNMVTGAARAEAAFLCIDASEGVMENSRRHAYLLSMLGIDQVVVLVNKMDVVGYSHGVFESVARDFRLFLADIDVRDAGFIPVSGREGDNVAWRSERMGWWSGPTVLSAIDSFRKPEAPVEQPFRMPVQDVYKFTAFGDGRRIVVGKVLSGSLRLDDEVVFQPSGKRSRVASIESFPAVDGGGRELFPGMAAGFTLGEQVYVRRGELLCKGGEQGPQRGTVIRVNMFWFGREGLSALKEYTLKIGTERVRARLVEVRRVIDCSSQDVVERTGLDVSVGRNDVCDCVFFMLRPVAFDLSSVLPLSSRFAVVDGYEIVGGGTVRQHLEDDFRNGVPGRADCVSARERNLRNGHRPLVILVSGRDGDGVADFSHGLERCLFDAGINVYYLGFGEGDESGRRRGSAIRSAVSILPGDRRSMIRRVIEKMDVFVDLGVVLVVSIENLRRYEVGMLRECFPRTIKTLWFGEGADDVWECVMSDLEGLGDYLNDLLAFLHLNNIDDD